MVTGLIRPTAGQVWFKDRNVSDVPMYKRARMGLGYLSQEPSIFRKLTVQENVMAILETLPISSRERRERLVARAASRRSSVCERRSPIDEAPRAGRSCCA
jgi:lipopolysaccharide export system ATP-binding protein